MARGYRTNVSGGGNSNPSIKYLFNDGDKCEKVTGGWTVGAYGDYSYRGATSLTFEQSYMLIANSSYSDYNTFGARTVNTINVDDYSELHILYENSVEQTVDISNIVGSYYVYVSMTFNSDVPAVNKGLIGLATTTSGNHNSTVIFTNIGYANPKNVQRVWLEK